MERFVRLLALLGGLVLLCLLCLIVDSVFMRRVFNAPPLGVYDMAEVMLIPVVFFGLAYTGLTKGHIAVDLISVFAKRSVVRWSDTIIYFICTCLVGLLTWQIYKLFRHSIKIDEVTQMVEIPYYPFIFIMILGGVAFTLVLLMQTWRAYRGIEEPDYHE